MQKSTETDVDGEVQSLMFAAEIGADKIQPTGTYTTDVTVTAVTLSGGGGGGGGGGGPTPPDGTDPQGCTFYNAEYGDTVNGTLDTSDCQSDPNGTPDPTGYYVEKILFSGTSGDKITFDASWVDSSGGLYLLDDFDSSFVWVGGNWDYPAPLQTDYITLPRTGTYTLWVTTIDPLAVGDYSVTINQHIPVACTEHSIAYGDTVNATLDTSDCQEDPYAPGTYDEKILFSGTAGDRIFFDASWPDSSGYLMLVDDSDGSIVWEEGDANNPASGDFGPIVLPTTGTYTLWVTTSSLHEVGDYSVALSVMLPLLNMSRVMTGDSHACASRDDGTVWCWGAQGNNGSALGNGSTTRRSFAVQTWGASGVGYFSGASDTGMTGEGSGNSCVRKDDGTIWCWGDNDFGQIGDNTTFSRLAPVQVAGTNGSGWLSDVTQLATGGVSSCALLNDQTARCWGNNETGQIGDETDIDRPAPVQVHGPSAVWRSLGEYPNPELDGIADMALDPVTGEPYIVSMDDSNGNELVVFRYNGTQWLQVGSTGKTTIGYYSVHEGGASIAFNPMTHEPYVAYLDGNDSGRAAVIRYDGSWHDVGNHPSPQNALPIQLRFGSSSSTLYLLFGKNGNPHPDPYPFVPGAINVWHYNGSSWSAVGGAPLCTYDIDGCYGGSLAVNPITGSPYVFYARPDGSTVVYYNGASWQTILSSSDWRKGANIVFDQSSGDPYIAVSDNSDFTASIKRYNGSSWTQIGESFGEAWIYAIAVDPLGVVYVSGANGISGLLRFTGSSWEPILAESGSFNPRYIGFGAAEIPYIAEYGQVFKFVEPDGAGSTYLNNISYIDTSNVAPGEGGRLKTSCAVRIRGKVFCWGVEDTRGYGQSTLPSKNFGVFQVAGPGGEGVINGVDEVSTGPLHVCAVKGLLGTVWCWGQNGSGQLGDGTNDYGYAPVEVNDYAISGPLTNISHITTSDSFTCALRGSDGTVWCWGNNDQGQLGTGNNDGSNLAVQVVGPGGSGHLSGVTQISARDSSTCARKSDSTVWCWGRNTEGKLGNGSLVDSVYPVQVMYRGESAPHADTIPDDFSFADINRTNEPCEELVTSELVTLSGFDGSLSVSIDGSGGSPEFMINNSGDWMTSGTITVGQTLRLHQMTVGPDGQWSVNVSVGLITRPWHVLTNACY